MKTQSIKKRFGILMMSAFVALSPIFQTQVFAAEAVKEEVTEASIEPRTGTETLPLGAYSIGGFTFYGWNTTPVKTIPSGASTVSFKIAWNGEYSASPRTKLYFQIRDTSGRALSPMYSQTDYYNPNDPNFVRCSELNIPAISVSPGQKIQLYFATDNDPSGAERGARIVTFTSYVY